MTEKMHFYHREKTLHNFVFGDGDCIHCVIKPNLAQINTPNHVLIVTYALYDHFMHWSKLTKVHFFINPL